jgi:hypothetical protein
MDALSEFGITQLPTPQNVWKGDQGGEGAGVNRLSFSTSAHPLSQSYRNSTKHCAKKALW